METLKAVFIFVFLFVCFNQVGSISAFAEPIISDENPLAMPEVGSYGLRILSPTLLELTLINTKEPDPAAITQWDFVGSNFVFTSPAASEFVVKAGSTILTVNKVGFRRRPLYAPLKQRDLRIENHLYLELNSGIAEGQAVEVTNPNARLWKSALTFTSVMNPLRHNPAIHVNQVGYQVSQQKLAMVGYYLGTLGEMKFNYQTGFKLVNASGTTVHQGSLTLRPDKGYSYTPTPYQLVYQADFSSFNTPGQYRLVVPGLGASFPFTIGDGIAATYARTFALGLYHQRCGGSNTFPYTRHTHENCHMADAEIPTTSFAKVQEFLNTVATESIEPRQKAPMLTNITKSLFPFVKQGKINTTGGHHDAGDYSKYTINSAGMIHSLVFAADSFPGVGQIDNLGLPESGDGKSDILQEAKWEADFLAKLQDADGGFYFLVYPKERRYEDDVTPDHGDPQVVWPKTTAVTAAAVAALAEAGSSPLMKKQFPVESAVYLAKAQLGWTFLMNAITKHGKDGSYQKLTHYGNEFMHDDELAWAAAALFAATGNQMYHSKLMEWFPNPNDPNTRRWSWWKMFEGYGNAIRTYAFAARSGRLPASMLNTSYLAKCEAEILAAGDDHVRFSNESAYGVSFPDTNKQYRSAGWFFASERAFDITTAYQITPKSQYAAAVIANWNYESGLNPVNMTYVTGLGQKRQRDVVHQTSQNDRQTLPPTGLPQGNIQAGFAYLYHYKSELGRLPFPADGANTAPYPFYDRWGDSFNTTCEFVVMDMARSLASVSFWMAQTSKKTQPWKAVQGQITGLPASIPMDSPVTVGLSAPGVDLGDALITWEVRYLEPGLGTTFTFSPKNVGEHWIEAEALLPDGRRIFAEGNFSATTSLNTPPNTYQSTPLANSGDMVFLYHADNSTADNIGQSPNLSLFGNARIDQSNLGWMSTRKGGALRFQDLGDKATVSIPTASFSNGSGTTAITLEAMVYVNELKAYNRDRAKILSFYEGSEAYMEFIEDKYFGPFIKGGTTWSISNPSVSQAITKKEWHHLQLTLSQNGYVFKVDGIVRGTLASSDISNWGKASTATLEIGNFDGWIDEISVRSARATTGGTGTAPIVTLKSPVNSTFYTAPARISMEAAVQSSSPISKVEFFVGTTKLGEDSTVPYQYVWSNAPAGEKGITARAIDIRGVAGVSGRATIMVNPSPSAVGAPNVLPMGGRFTGQTKITVMTPTAGATLRYTLDGSNPTTTSTLYTGPFVLNASANLKVQGFKAGMENSPVTTAAFTIVPQDDPNQVVLVATDTKTKGSWKGVYGSQGYEIFGESDVNPSFGQVKVTGASSYIWSQNTTDVRALQNGAGSTRVALANHASASFTIEANVTDMKSHQFSLYMLDWDRTGRQQLVEAYDPDSGAILNSQLVSNFGDGVYLVYEIKGKVSFKISALAGPNAVVMGYFFDAAISNGSATLVPVGVAGNGVFGLKVTGVAGKEYAIQTSEDNKTWLHIGYLTLTQSTGMFYDTGANWKTARFYRAICN
ncbi:MAG: glycoside hydrolase family 9 protein [Verrucomicrobiales bacterium]